MTYKKILGLTTILILLVFAFLTYTWYVHRPEPVVIILPVTKLEEAATMFREGSSGPEVILSFEEAITYARENPELPGANETIAYAYRGIGLVYFQMGEYQIAEDHLLTSIDLGVESTPILFNMLGFIAKQNDNIELAIERFEEGISLKTPENELLYSEVFREMLFNLVVSYEDLREWELAREAAYQFLAIFPDDEEMIREFVFLQTR